METIKVFLSPNYQYPWYVDAVTGMKFEQSNRLEVHSIHTEGLDLSGIQSALRKNILLPFDAETREYVNGTNFATPSVAKEEPAKEEPVVVAKAEKAEETKEPAVKEEEKKPARKSTKKDK